jgi:hypothetical protein
MNSLGCIYEREEAAQAEKPKASGTGQKAEKR